MPNNIYFRELATSIDIEGKFNAVDILFTNSPDVTAADVQEALEDTYNQLEASIAALVSGVSSVNTATGAVVLDTDDIGEGSANLYYTDTRADARITLQKGAASGLCELDGSGKVPAARLPAIATTQVDVVADITARDALTPAEGDHAIVTDAGADPAVPSGEKRSYLYDGAAWQLLPGDPDLTAAEVKTKYESNSDTNAFTDALLNKLNAIEANAKDDQSAAEVSFSDVSMGTVAGANVQAIVEALKSYLDTELAGKKDDFSENSAFNKDFGSTAGTVCEGNDSRLFSSNRSALAGASALSFSDQVSIRTDALSGANRTFTATNLVKGHKVILLLTSSDSSVPVYTSLGTSRTEWYGGYDVSKTNRIEIVCTDDAGSGEFAIFTHAV